MINEIGFSTYHEVIAYELRAALRRYFDKWDSIQIDKGSENFGLAGFIEQYRISVIILSAALVEYSINFYLSTKCLPLDFNKLDRKPLFEKWQSVPKQFVPTYDLPIKSELGADLANLIARRKTIVHAKPAMSIDGDNRHVGNFPAVDFDENDFIRRCSTLPLRLIDNLLQFSMENFSEISCLQRTLGMVACEYDKWQGRRSAEIKCPPELIQEIMMQGYNRTIAVYCALHFSEHPPQMEKVDVLIVRQIGKEIARLRPLRFFGMA